MSYDPIDHPFERGLHKRRQILGAEWVMRAVGNANHFTADFQNLITRFAWHEVWDRPGLDTRTRRVIVLAITLALGRWEEFDLHARAALLGSDGDRITPDELKELLMQAAIYAGVPAANTGFGHAQQILREIGPQIGYELAAQAPADAVHPGLGRLAMSSSTPRLYHAVRPPRSGKTPQHTVVLSHALGCDLSMWDDLATHLAATCRVIVYDHRGHGSSDTATGPCTIADLADDAARLLRELDSGPVVWIGLSLGAMVGQELALRHPSLIAALVLASSCPAYPPEMAPVWQQRSEQVSLHGLDAIADAVMARFFSAEFCTTQAAIVSRYRRRLTSTDRASYLACLHAVAAHDTVDRLSQIGAPTLVLAGELDASITPAMSAALTGRIPLAEMGTLPHAAHLSVVEQPAAFAGAVCRFLRSLATPSDA